MINKEGKIALTNGQKTRWVLASATLPAGWYPVNEVVEVEEPAVEDTVEVVDNDIEEIE
jgi:hypothetical protein